MTAGVGHGAAIALVFAALGFGCAHRSHAPDAAVDRFARAVARGDFETAYRSMSVGYRERVSLQEFRAEMAADSVFVTRTAGLRTPAVGPPVSAVVSVADGDRVRLVWEGGVWKIEDQWLAPFAQHSPRAALRSFVRAIRARRYDVVLRLVPARHGGDVTIDALRAFWEGPAAAARKPLLDALTQNLGGPIEETGAEARLSLGKLGEVRFVREDGVWKIEDAG